MTDLDGKFVYVNFLHEHCAPRVGCIYYAGETLEKSQVGVAFHYLYFLTAKDKR
jgi:hypothetical protein